MNASKVPAPASTPNIGARPACESCHRDPCHCEAVPGAVPEQTGRVLGPVPTPALTRDLDIALDVLGDKLLRLASELHRGVDDVHTRMEAAGALDRAALHLPSPHAATARLQAVAVRERPETLTAQVVDGWHVAWARLGDELAGLVAPPGEMAVTDGEEPRTCAFPGCDAPTEGRPLCGEHTAVHVRSSAWYRDLSPLRRIEADMLLDGDDGLVVVAVDACRCHSPAPYVLPGKVTLPEFCGRCGFRVRAPRSMLDADAPPSCLAGGVTTRADVAPLPALVALAEAGEL
jgi:hypothetical protein